MNCVWFWNVDKALSTPLNALLRSSLDEIDPQLRVTVSISAVIRAVDKEFSLLSNYPKGHGELFREWVREYYPGMQLLRVELAAGSRQDLCTKGSLPVYIYYPYYVEFLDSALHKPWKMKNKSASILQKNLFDVLTFSDNRYSA